jgi:rod shape determining protein RodA
MFSHGGTSFIIFAILFGILLNLIAFKRYFQYNADARITMMEKDAISRDLRTPVSVRRKRPEQEISSVEAKLASLKKHPR